MDCTTRDISIAAINVSARIRKDTGGIEELAADIRERRLINPITVMDCCDGKYQLIAGLRRLEAIKSIGCKEIRATILSPMDADEQLRMEYAENVQRKDFTNAERLEYADKIKAVEKAKARERMAAHARDGHDGSTQGVRICAHPKKGKTRDHIAEKAGFSSSRQYERAAVIAEKQPDLLEKIDAGEMTISAAYKEVMQKTETAAAEVPSAAPLSSLETLFEKPRPDQVIRAGHDRLMKNPLYSELWAKWKNAVADANTAVTELEFRSAGYENRIRNYQDNVAALSRRCESLEQENVTLRVQLEKFTGGNP